MPSDSAPGDAPLTYRLSPANHHVCHCKCPANLRIGARCLAGCPRRHQVAARQVRRSGPDAGTRGASRAGPAAAHSQLLGACRPSCSASLHFDPDSASGRQLHPVDGRSRPLHEERCARTTFTAQLILDEQTPSPAKFATGSQMSRPTALATSQSPCAPSSIFASVTAE
jgi:hypothetical protein